MLLKDKVSVKICHLFHFIIQYIWDNYPVEARGEVYSTKIPTGPTGKSDPPQKVDQIFSKLFRLKRADPLSFGLKFPEILVEWIAPPISQARCFGNFSIIQLPT